MKAGLGHLKVTPHKLRHTAASLAVASGADVNVVQTMPGHRSALAAGSLISLGTSRSSYRKSLASTTWVFGCRPRRRPASRAARRTSFSSPISSRSPLLRISCPWCPGSEAPVKPASGSPGG
ncbi:tyrosine-type recombinase/integrase [Streptomyces badius]